MAKQKMTDRRALIAGLGVAAAAGALGASAAEAQTAPGASFTPTIHPQDDWMSAMKGQHRIVVDVTYAKGVPDLIRFSNNLLQGHKNGWGVEESDVAVIVCVRHQATAYGYSDAMWAKYGKTMDPSLSPVPTANPYNTGGENGQLAQLAKRGVQFMVCGTASRGLAQRIAGQGGDVEAVLKELAANLIPSARIVPAGVVAVVHAQERRFIPISISVA